jgi:trk system potassium uptake protein TrkH
VIAARRMPRPALFSRIGVDVGAALGLVGTLLKYISLSALLPAAVALGYSEPVWPFIAAGGIAAATGLALERLATNSERAGLREGFLVVSLIWLFAALYGALPYAFAQEVNLGNGFNAVFESMSGFTTTGSSVVSDPAELSRSLLIWRQFTQWLGGMGIIVLFLAVLPRLRVGGRQLFEAEAPGHAVGGLATTIRDAARRFVVLYIAITAVETLVLAVFGWTRIDGKMGLYDAVAHAFTTLPTGGFSTKGASLAAFSATTQWTVVVFMVIAGTNFALLFRVFVRGHLGTAARDEEFRLYLTVLTLASLVVFIELLSEGIAGGYEALRLAVFNAVSIGTTTGYATADFNEWTSLTTVSLVGLMFIAASAGSTSGGVKVVRHLLIGKMLRRELAQTVHPELVSPVRLNGKPIDERILRAVIVFVLLYVGVFAVGTLGLVIESARADSGVSPFEAIAAAATTLANVGPGFGFAGSFGNFDGFSNLSKTIMVALMWLGRLEVIPIVVLFTRPYWRR